MSVGMKDVSVLTWESGDHIIRSAEPVLAAEIVPNLDNSKNYDRREIGCICDPKGADEMKYPYKRRVIVGQDESGKDICKWAVARTQRELNEKIYALKAEAQETAQGRGHPFDAYAGEWLEVFKKPALSPNTYQQYRSKVKRLIEYFGDRDICDLSVKDVQGFLNSQQSKAKSYVRDVLNILRQIFDSAVDDEIISKNPAKNGKIVNTGHETEERRDLTQDERRRVETAICNMDKAQDRMYLATIYYTGMRPGEPLGLAWEDIDWEGKRIFIRHAVATHGNEGILGTPKTDAGKRTLPLMDQLAEVLKPHRGTGLIFLNKKGKPYTGQGRKRLWERIREYANLPEDVVPYTLRHSMGTFLRDAEVDIKASQSIMGHADSRVTLDVYSKQTPQQIEAATRKLQEAFGQCS